MTTGRRQPGARRPPTSGTQALERRPRSACRNRKGAVLRDGLGALPEEALPALPVFGQAALQHGHGRAEGGSYLSHIHLALVQQLDSARDLVIAQVELRERD